jgi:hypothetical protein
MSFLEVSPFLRRSAVRFLLTSAGGLAFLGSAAVVRPDEKSAETVGAIEGEAIAVRGPMSVEVAGGEVRTVLLSGSEVRVKSGRARIQLREGGAIAICGPAHLSVLKSGGALTVALEYGTIHAQMEREPSLVVYTPLIQAKPVAIGEAPVDTVVGLETTGAMCLRAGSGAVRLEQQLTGQSVLVPQAGDVLLANGQIESLRAGGNHCRCEAPLAKANAPAEKSPEVSRMATAEELRAASAAKTAEQHAHASDLPAQAGPLNPPAREEPVYKVLMPPLSFDASAAGPPPEPSPAMILLVRTVRVRPTLIFRGHVEEPRAEVASANSPDAVHGSAPGPPLTPNATSPASVEKPSIISRVRTFLRRLWSAGS